MAFWRKRRPAKTTQDKLDELLIEQKRESLEARRAGRTMVQQAIELGRPDLVAPAALLLGKTGKLPSIPSRESSREDRLVDILLTRALEDPEDRLDRLREAAIKRRALERELADDDDDRDDGPQSWVKQLLPSLPLLLGMVNPQAQTLIQTAIQAQTAPVRMADPLPDPALSAAPLSPPPAPAPPLPAASAAGMEAAGDPLSYPDTGGTVIPIQLQPGVVLRNLETFSPEAFADWLLTQPGGWDFAQRLLAIPEADMAQQLATYSSLPAVMLGGWAPVLKRIAADPARATAIVAALRQRFGAQSSDDTTELAM